MASTQGIHELALLSSASKGTTARASSTWQHNAQKFGPLNALDSETDSAWKSASSEGHHDPMQFYEVHFHRPVHVRELRVQFQGGFVGMDCIVYRKKSQRDPIPNNNQSNASYEWEEFDELFMETIDSNEVQIFCVELIRTKQTMKHVMQLELNLGKQSLLMKLTPLIKP
ncbi:hypothetical protein HJC23_009844 [Cyclotella cryptica]|uniref:F5/8 type C domain-containing protein n=1 Tax=Cyclotella cryptica TaxID=29204 RepID=A0ABD3NTR0_9STRA